MQLIWISLLAAATLAAQPVDLLVTARRVLTMDSGRRIVENGAVAVQGGRIIEVGPSAELTRKYQARRVIRRPGAILLPGLINAHTHAPMSLLRGIADDLKLQEWLEKYIFPAEARNVDEAFCRAGTRLAILEMLLSGTTTYVDMYYFEHAVAEETKKVGMRAILGQTIIGFPAPDYKTPASALAGTEAFIQRFRNDPLITPAVAPHAIYTNSTETLQAARALADRYGVPLVTHVSETERENNEARQKYGGKTPTEYLDSIGGLARWTLFAHGVWLTPDDRRIMKRRSVGLAHCPSSNMKLASGMAPVSECIAEGIAVGLGPDGPAGSNNDFSVMEEMDLASKLAKVRKMDPTALPARTVVEMATIMGARAIGLDRHIGSLEAGKRADFITVALDGPHAWPAHDAYSMLVSTLKSSDVTDVVIEGRVVVESRRPLTINPASVRAEAEAARARVEASLKAPAK
jgi:5-methylthioadenosine/S-adenosylhomocysteine deaminase